MTVAFVIASTDLSSLLLLPSSFSTEMKNVIWGRTNFNWSYTSLLIILRDFLPPLDFTSVLRTYVISLWNFGSWDSSFFSFSFSFLLFFVIFTLLNCCFVANLVLLLVFNTSVLIALCFFIKIFTFVRLLLFLGYITFFLDGDLCLL